MGSHYSVNTVKSNRNSPIYSRDGALKSLALTDSGDLDFGTDGKSPYFISGIDRIKQDLYLILKSVKGSSDYCDYMGVDMVSIINEDYDPIVMMTEIETAVKMHRDIATVKGMKVKENSEYSLVGEDIQRKKYVEFHAITKENEDIFVSVIL